MSALTFDTLSAELTQALLEQLDTPPKTTARCTLSREKVMVLVEYPLDSASAESQAAHTLDWLEQHLRHQFNTTGLPEEVVDLSEAVDEVAVQLYLKHLSESKPFKMRAFTWKVDDGFSELFGESGAIPLGSGQTDFADTNFADTDVSPDDSAAFADIEALQAKTSLDELVDDSIAEESLIDDLTVDSTTTHTSTGALQPFETGLSADDFLPNPQVEPETLQALAEEEEAFILATLEEDHPGMDADLDSALDLDDALNDELAEGVPTVGSPEISTDSSEADLEAALSEGISAPTVVIPTTSEEFSLPGEEPTLPSADFELPTVEMPITLTETDTSKSTDFFSLNEALESESKSESSRAETDAGPSAALPTTDLDFSSVFSGTSHPSVTQNKTTTDLFDTDLFDPVTSTIDTPTDEEAPISTTPAAQKAHLNRALTIRRIISLS